MKNLLLIPLILMFSNGLHAQPKNTSSANSKIIAGWLINSLGVGLLIQSSRIAKDPVYNYSTRGKTAQQNKVIGVAALGGICLLVGSLNIVKGMKQKNQQLLGIGATSNGIGFIYKI